MQLKKEKNFMIEMEFGNEKTRFGYVDLILQKALIASDKEKILKLR